MVQTNYLLNFVCVPAVLYPSETGAGGHVVCGGGSTTCGTIVEPQCMYRDFADSRACRKSWGGVCMVAWAEKARGAWRWWERKKELGPSPRYSLTSGQTSLSTSSPPVNAAAGAARSARGFRDYSTPPSTPHRPTSPFSQQTPL